MLHFTDSLIQLNITMRNLNPSNLCDSTITRYIFVAPVPKTSFSAVNACNGERVSFTNLTTISTGTVTYNWTYGDGNTSTFINPEYKYGTFGTYQVKLTAKSDLGYTKDTLVTVNVYEVPTISFKPLNACEGDSITFNNNTTIGTGTLSYLWILVMDLHPTAPVLSISLAMPVYML